jgi:dihydroorotate dehydrogenase electron transfer subunit
MAALDAGAAASVIGPLGNGFPMGSAGAFPVLIAGGYGMAPLRLLAARSARPGIVMIGARTARDVLCRKELETLGWQVCVATEDGTEGRKGLVTALLSDWLAGDAKNVTPELFACGPDGMLKAICKIAAESKLKAWVSIERRMGCGVGACLACVVDIRDEAGKTKRVRACKDGPVFESGLVVW